MVWEQVWGATDYVVVDGETGSVFARPAESAGLGSSLFQWDGTADGWTSIGSPELDQCVAAGWSPWSSLFGTDGQGVVHRYALESREWSVIGGPANGSAKAIYGGPDQLIAAPTTDPSDLYRWKYQTGTWERIGGPARQVAIGKSVDVEFRLQVYALSPDDAPQDEQGIYVWKGKWYKAGGPAEDIWVSETQLFATNPHSGDILMKSPTGWKRIGGPGHQFVTDHQGHLYGLSLGQTGVYRWSGTPNQWSKVGGPAERIYAGWDGLLFGISPATSDLWVYRGGCPEPGTLPDFSGVIHTKKLDPALGARRLMVVLWDPHRPEHPRPSRESVEAAIFGPKPSLRDWIQENSGGRATLANVGVFGWYDAPAGKQGEHYWDNPDPDSPDPARRKKTYHADKYKDGWLSGHPEKWADTVRRVAEDIDLKGMDENGDGSLSTSEVGLFLCYPQNKPRGYYRPTFNVQHPKAEQPLVVGGLKVPYIVEWYLGNPPSFGVGMHELCHLIFGTPDMYFKGHWPYAAASYSLMDQALGQHLDAPEKLKLGWLDYKVVTSSGDYELADVETTNSALVVMNPRRGPSEFFLLENRWRGTSYDAILRPKQDENDKDVPAVLQDGLAIWHVIEDPDVFNTVAPWPPTGVKGEWGRLGIRMIRANGGNPVDDHHALFTTASTVVSDVTAQAKLRWLHDRPSGITVRLLSGAGPSMTLRIGVNCP